MQVLSWVALVCGVFSLVLTNTFISPFAAAVGLILGWRISKKSKDPKQVQRGKIAMIAGFFGITSFIMMMVLAQAAAGGAAQ